MDVGSVAQGRNRRWRLAATLAAVIATAAVVWMDINTGLWQETVILSGIAAGMLTFALTALYIDRFVERAAQRRWLPITRLALTDILHSLADAEHSELSRGKAVPRLLPAIPAPTAADLTELLEAVTQERTIITDSLARWAGFLAGSADVQALMTHIAAVAESLETVRDATIEAEESDTALARSTLADAIAAFNTKIRLVTTEIQNVLSSIPSQS